jgi:ferrous iron transport protein B
VNAIATPAIAAQGTGGPEAVQLPGEIVLVGNPNVGKSALFGALTGSYVVVSNYPGTTVEITSGAVTVGGQRLRLVDTPGVLSLLPASEDERVTRDLLLSRRPRAVVVVGDAKNLERTLALALQVAEMGLPLLLCLNMMDEASARGIGVDVAALAARLGVSVVPTVAVRHEGIRQLLDALGRPRRPAGEAEVRYPDAIEAAVERVAPLLPESPLSGRSLALMALAGDATLWPWLRERMPADRLAEIETAREELRRAFPEHLAYVLQWARLRAAASLAAAVTRRPQATRPGARALARRLESLSVHPVYGLGVLGAVLFAMYLFVGVLGAGTLVDLLENGLFGRYVNPWAIAAVERFLPWDAARALLVGPYGIITMALTYALALVLPIVGTFFIAFGILEDSGYLPRLAVMADRGLRAMGLNGKAVLPMVLGLGCDTMATLTTRVLETPKERLIVILLLALGVPCSSQLAVTLALLQPISPLAMLIWAAVVVGVIVGVGRMAASLLPGKSSDFVMELPPMRLPQASNIAYKTLARVEWYLREAVPLFVLGTVLLFVADRLRLLGTLEAMAQPVLTGGLGLPPETAEAFVVGFLRRDFGAAGLYRLAEAGRLDPVQVLVSVVVTTLFIPCIANFLMIVRERGLRTGLAIAGFILPFAFGVGALLNLVLRALGVDLR